MSLKTLMLARCVSSDWRRLVSLADLHPTRRRFWELYDNMLANPLFLESRLWTMVNLKSFDREAYIETLLAQCFTPEAEIPEDFEMYILEWPARMAIGGAWPGLPFVDSQMQSIQRADGINFLTPSSQLSALVFKHTLPEACWIPALLIWHSPRATTWVLFDKTPHEHLKFKPHGRVIDNTVYPNPPCGDEVDDPSILDYDYDPDTDTDNYDGLFQGALIGALPLYIAKLIPGVGIYEKLGWQDTITNFVHPSWIRFLETSWTGSSEPLKSPWSPWNVSPVKLCDGAHTDLPLDTVAREINNIGYEYLNRSYRDIPAPPWTRRREMIFQGRLVSGSVSPPLSPLPLSKESAAANKLEHHEMYSLIRKIF